MSDAAAVEGFIKNNTRLLSPPLVPEIKLHLAEESVPLWQKTEDELGEMNIPPPFWAFAWAGGQALARYLLDNPEISRAKRGLDLGCGSGLTGIAAMLAGAQSILGADIDALALSATHLNARENNVSLTTTQDDMLPADLMYVDLILIGDLFYERALAEAVIAFIDRAKAQGATVLIGDPKRSYFPRDRFRLVANFNVAVSRDLEDAEIKNSSVWQA